MVRYNISLNTCSVMIDKICKTEKEKPLHIAPAVTVWVIGRASFEPDSIAVVKSFLPANGMLSGLLFHAGYAHQKPGHRYCFVH